MAYTLSITKETQTTWYYRNSSENRNFVSTISRVKIWTHIVKNSYSEDRNTTKLRVPMWKRTSYIGPYILEVKKLWKTKENNVSEGAAEKYRSRNKIMG